MGASNIPAGGRHWLTRRTAPSTTPRSARGGGSVGWRCAAAIRPGTRSMTSAQLSGSAAISRGTRTGGRWRTNARYIAISRRNRSAHAGEWSSRHLATALPRPVVPARSTDRPLRRSTCTGLNSGQIRWTEVIAVRSCAPCGPDKSSLPRGGTGPRAAVRGARPPGAGSRYGPVPGSCRRYGRGGADTEDDAAYMGETDPFVCRRIAYAPGPGGGPHPGECGRFSSSRHRAG